ncbi:MAG: hypothetical protein IPJ27_07790 [Candidatus Accumulibacter sp.]|uniref:Uncharacterized protein n=1 Tax=Candidatus Accumulibacter proximus TaxID=2954385 RepID=A0A935PWK8_9PROT|nr:hypothetical protein [Candidatus Accumulibacter proximus]
MDEVAGGRRRRRWFPAGAGVGAQCQDNPPPAVLAGEIVLLPRNDSPAWRNADT